MLLTILFALIYSVNIGLSQDPCTWMDPDTEIILDLRPLSNRLLTTIDDQQFPHNYLYTPCRNDLFCDQDIMVKQTVMDDPDMCFNLGTWDQNIQPQYTNDNGVESWQFVYNNGAPDCGTPARTWAPVFICDPDIDVEIGTVDEVPGSCWYDVEIITRYACQNYTTTTTNRPDNQCAWNDGDHTLNLTRIQGFILYKISDNDPQQIYSLTPCSNSLNCNGDNVMSTVGTISNCIQSIARWEQGINEPTYSSNFGGQWEFVYTNGDRCINDGARSVVTVFWNCNPFGGSGKITAARQTGTCAFEIQIDSNLACD